MTPEITEPRITQLPQDMGASSQTPAFVAEQELRDLQNRFYYHSPSAVGVTRHAELSNGFFELAKRVLEICPAGRERSLVLTKLEEAKFWASAAVARNKETC